MNLSTKQARKLRQTAVLVLQARHALTMLYHPEYFPQARQLVSLAMKLLGRKGRNLDWRAKYLAAPTVRIKLRERAVDMPETDRVARGIEYGWWLMSYGYTVGVDITPDSIINSIPKKKEN